MHTESQIISKHRVSTHGEVLTGSKEVNAMLDLVRQEAERIDSRFLEPACGTGNFLKEILKRKLDVVETKYSKIQLDYERYSIIALSSIYGIDILEDNVISCRETLLGIITEYYLKNYKKEFKADYLSSAEFILSRNVVWGDALTLKTPDEKDYIVFSEWSAVNGSMIKRRDFKFEHLLSNQPMYGDTLFNDAGEEAFIPRPVAEFPLTHFLKLGLK